ncbi:MAG: UDP-N-acetylmuramate:L-alanyl-gamma-D-glutamyl-meso-diaminopimelate ligase [Gammaproteobacteria bacterium]|nr:UDP-N-acetylmuramate:L-alanyl-gamma-D-glutamyl-meso-diaminopimelate ligase [Gammaproteobacteria bacterium]MCZ6715873.1 UDP-N-acetylmuramate:L-alanyl-gamma-D-glutamyl-meso-diaminopimelate ligase [Gammaproteobacteria bacterium]MCZ6826946.1 UDP-N-acetylmuramate:L-alanyl-gamma-D-glutamyl-meso-diaminopimelate ligase [Gammaproteobacteria bacterium]MCZ6879723.1 UDP-N-acetylmuramate:L-alanyl-gamma-D-glutamyl-meso-diaminopimelate ligase [Gammaproteobacteria bacterium]
MHIHILGICGTFMGGVAALATEAGHEVTGSDRQVYPPMSTQLEYLGVTIMDEDDPAQLEARPDEVIVGNVMSRGRGVVEALLNSKLPYTSGPEWLARNILKDRWVLAVAGTHGKTSCSSMLAWILEDAGLNPGFLIGGMAGNFSGSARLGNEPFFVVEADEYDTAFFDKRAKFVHYRPRTLVLNNLEYDHADIYPDLAAIATQFHHLIRTVPGDGLLVCNGDDDNLAEVIEQGCWTRREMFLGNGEWQARHDPSGQRLQISFADTDQAECHWPMMGGHSVANALAAVAAARHAGVPLPSSVDSLSRFAGVKRRMELRGEVRGVSVYDDFAHHPTAIRATLDGFREAHPESRIHAVLEPRSNTMRLGVHRDRLAESLQPADRSWLFRPADLQWDLDESMALPGQRISVYDDTDEMAIDIAGDAREGDIVLVMSNGSFNEIHQKLLDCLATDTGD